MFDVTTRVFKRPLTPLPYLVQASHIHFLDEPYHHISTRLEMERRATDKVAGKSEYSVRRVGRPFTTDHRIYFERTRDKLPVSPFHDIPLYHDKKRGILNMVVEIPRWTNAKFEVQ
jgi:inorganic pyrophosphatase